MPSYLFRTFLNTLVYPQIYISIFLLFIENLFSKEKKGIEIKILILQSIYETDVISKSLIRKNDSTITFDLLQI